MTARSLQLWLLRMTTVGLLLTVATVAIDPQVGRREPAVVAMPEAIPLSGWQLQSQTPIASQGRSRYSQIRSGAVYHYRQTGYTLTLELRYLINTQGDIPTLLQQYQQQSQSVQSRLIQHPAGAYLLSQDRQFIYLDSCINPRGNATVTGAQFMQNRYDHDLQLSRWLPWLLGQQSLLDHRCLWVRLKISTQSTGQQSTDQRQAMLQQSWLSVIERWRSEFPTL